MNKEGQSIVTLLVGGAMLRISLTDVYLRYVKEGVRPFLIAAGALLVVIAVATLWRDVLRPAAAAVTDGQAGERGQAGVQGQDGEHGQDGDHGHGGEHSHGGPLVAWLLVLPVLAIFLIAPPALGSYTASRQGSVTAQTAKSVYPPLPQGDPVQVTVVDYASRALWDKDGASLRGRTIRLTGFVTPREAGGVYLTRVALSCCAADGLAIKVTLVGPVPDELAADSWIQVTGRYRSAVERDKISGEWIAAIEVLDLLPVVQPRNPYDS